MRRFTTRKRRKQWELLCPEKAERIASDQKKLYGAGGHRRAFKVARKVGNLGN